MLALSTLAAVGYLDAFEGASKFDASLVKARLLHEINERLTSQETATAHATMSAMVILISFELSQGNDEAVMHLRGLKRIIDICQPERPAFDFMLEVLAYLPFSQIQSLLMLNRLDLTQAIMFDSHLKVTTLRKPADGTMRAIQSIPGTNFLERLPVLLDCQMKQAFVLPMTTSVATIVGDAKQLLSSAIACTATAVRTSEISDEDADVFFEHLSKFSQIHCGEVVDENTAYVTHLSRAIHQGFAILYNLICNQNLPGHTSHESYIDGLGKAMDQVPYSIWSRIPLLQLWM
jgi:hypothetical protein